MVSSAAATDFTRVRRYVMATVPTQDPLDAAGPCQGCRQVRQLQFVMFFRNVGMLLARQTITIQGDLCRSCIHRRFREFTGKNILFGPWGMISLVVTPIHLVQNTWSYTRALYKLRNAIE